jgi:uncharacterized protein (TIGR01244 family)
MRLSKKFTLRNPARTAALGIVVCGLLLAALSSRPAVDDRPAHWARPVTVPGVENAYLVTADLYRSAQPPAQAFAELKKFGIRTVINLRSKHSDREKALAAGLNYVAIPSQASNVDEHAILLFLRTVSDPARGPYLVYCHHGADRTGLMIAVFRVVVQGWTKEEAIREMRRGGYGFHSIYTNIVRYLKKFDPDKFRKPLNG